MKPRSARPPGPMCCALRPAASWPLIHPRTGRAVCAACRTRQISRVIERTQQPAAAASLRRSLIVALLLNRGTDAEDLPRFMVCTITQPWPQAPLCECNPAPPLTLSTRCPVPGGNGISHLGAAVRDSPAQRVINSSLDPSSLPLNTLQCLFIISILPRPPQRHHNSTGPHKSTSSLTPRKHAFLRDCVAARDLPRLLFLCPVLQPVFPRRRRGHSLSAGKLW